MARKKVKERATVHYNVWSIDVGKHRLVFSGKAAADTAAEMIASHTGGRVTVNESRFYYDLAPLEDLVDIVSGPPLTLL